MEPVRDITPASSEEEPNHKKRRNNPYSQTTPEWKSCILQTKNDKSLILNGANFVRRWELYHAVRDLLQNAVDSMLHNHRAGHHKCDCSVTVLAPPSSWDGSKRVIEKFHIMNAKGELQEERGLLSWEPKGENDEGPTLTIINRDAAFGPEALSIGCSSKGHRDAGGHGEGLKAAATVCCREGLKFEISTSGITARFAMDKFITYRVFLAKSKKLHFAQKTKALAKELKISPAKDVIVHLGNAKGLDFQTVVKAAECFLYFTHRPVQQLVGEPADNQFLRAVVQRTAHQRSLLTGDSLAGRVYVRDILFETRLASQTRWAVNFNPGDAPNRDRDQVDTKHYCKAMGALLNECIENDASFAKTLLEEFRQESEVEHLRGLPEAATVLTKARLIEAFKEQNPDVEYIIAGKRDLIESNELVPLWCDARACLAVHPILYELIRNGYPSIEAIKKAGREKLLRCEVDESLTQEVRHWLQSNLHLLQGVNGRTIDIAFIKEVQVRDTKELLDVPLVVLPSLIFSKRGIELKNQSEFAFLTLVRDALQELSEQLSEQDPIEELQLQLPADEEVVDQASFSPVSSSASEISIVASSVSERSIALASDFENLPLDANLMVPNDTRDQIPKLNQLLSTSIALEDQLIRCTQEALNQWEEIARSHCESLYQLTQQAMAMCRSALDILDTKSAKGKCSLAFYIAGDSSPQGFASKKDGIHINLRATLAHAERQQMPEEKAMKAYFNVLIAHEYAHFLDDSDGHSPHHALRTEEGMRRLMQH